MSSLPDCKLHGIKAFILILVLKLLNSTINGCVFIDTHTHTYTNLLPLQGFHCHHLHMLQTDTFV